MKKLLSLALVVFMVMSLCVTAVVPASAEATKVFSLDLSDGTVKNGVAGSSSTITGGDGSTITTVAEIGTKVLDIGTKGYAVTDQNINILASQDFTVEWWAKADNAIFSGWMGSFRNNSSQYSFKSQNAASATSQWRTDRHYVPTGETAAKELNVPIPTSTCSDYTAWNHFAITDSYDSSSSTGTVTVYLNGKQAATDRYTGARVTIETLNIGQANAEAAYFAGFIGAFDVYSGALSATEIAANYKNSIKDYYDVDTSGLLFDLDLSDYDKNSADAAKGIKDKTKDLEDETLTLANSLEIQSEKLGDRTVNVMNLKNGEKGGINAADSAVNTAASGTTLTLESWMKIDSSNNEHYFLYTNDSSHNWQVMVKNSGTTDLQFVDRAHNGATDQVECTHTASKVRNEWAHYVFTREYKTSGLVQKLYVNGELVSENTASNSATAPHSTNGYTMYIGGGNFAEDNGIAMNGQIATFKVYEQALSAAEVSATYANELDTYYDLDKSGLLFDLDLSGYAASSTDAAKGIKDKTKDLVTETISLVGSATITKLSEASDVKVLNINDSTQKGGINAEDTAVAEAASGNTMTVESWMKIDDKGGHYLLYSTPSAAHNWQIMPDGADKDNTHNVTFVTKLHNSYEQRDVTAKGTLGSWAHYVFTREYKDSCCVQKLFVNGVLMKEYTSGVTEPQAVTNGIMYIGGGSYNSYAISMNGSIATFKVYNKALTEAEAKAKFAAEASTYGVTVLTDVSLDGGVAWKSGDNTISAIGSDTAALSAGFTLKNNTAAAETVFCALALYDADGNLVKCTAEDNISLAAGATANKTLSLTELTVGDGYSAKLLVWKSGTLQPYFTAVTINSAGESQVCL